MLKSAGSSLMSGQVRSSLLMLKGSQLGSWNVLAVAFGSLTLSETPKPWTCRAYRWAVISKLLALPPIVKPPSVNLTSRVPIWAM